MTFGFIELKTMSWKGKTALLVGVIAVVLLGLYRNFGVPVFRFWPLILIDTLTRFPGDKLLLFFHLRIPEVAYEFLRGLLQIPMVLLFWRGAAKSIYIFLSKRRKASPPATQVVLPPAEAWIMKKWKMLVAFALLGSILLIPRCGRQLVSLASDSTGVHPYPLYVVTEVSIEGSELKVETNYFSLFRSKEFAPNGDARSPGAFEFQEALLLKKRRAAPLLRPGRLTVKSLPPEISQEQSAWLEQRALDILNAFEDVGWYYTAEANLVLSQDGTKALYRINAYSYDGPLAAIGSIYAVEFIKTGDHWVAERFGLVSLWIS
jgi:hypothetical protein